MRTKDFLGDLYTFFSLEIRISWAFVCLEEMHRFHQKNRISPKNKPVQRVFLFLDK